MLASKRKPKGLPSEGRGHKFESCRAPLFDSYVRERSLADRLSFYPGDFFKDPFPPADVLVIGRVLHNWDLATKKIC